ncbi:MAG TPA: hypothetical protein DGG95_16620, partial [Cytophagales bacterium]|nr:hypothetical protein [Cytophagales bacterium]
DFASAERLLKQSVDMDSFVDKVYFYLATAYLMNNKKELACAAFKKSKERNDGLVNAELERACK